MQCIYFVNCVFFLQNPPLTILDFSTILFQTNIVQSGLRCTTKLLLFIFSRKEFLISVRKEDHTKNLKKSTPKQI